jgi:long-chain acyl-CoA synthetase
MAHAYESNIQIYLFFFGCIIGFSSGNIKKLMDEIKLFQPEVTSLVPKILSRIVASIELKLNDLTGMKKRLANRAIKSKLENVRNNSSSISHTIYDKLIFNKIKALTGGKLAIIHSGSAPLTRNVFEKIQIFLSARIVEGYGLTESLAASIIHDAHLPGVSVGVPLPTIQYKLVDVPDLNYFVKNTNRQGIPTPQGLIYFKGDSLFQRYYKNEELTKEAFKDGWFITGDVGMTNENGLLFIIDRVKSLIKLQQGEYISPERLEGVYSKSLMIAHIYIYGDPERSDVVAIISVENEAVKKWAEKQKIATDKMDEQFLNENLKMVIANELKAFAKEQNLNRWEFPRNMYITKKEFSIENNLITPTMKLKRRECAVFFKEEIKKCYEMDYMFPIEH